MVSSGMRAAGYKYVIIDEWSAQTRDAGGRLVADPRRFPSGMPALCAYLHARQLGCGIYTTCGPTTCQRRCGSAGHAAIDAATFAAWGADYVFVDACGDQQFYRDFAMAINATGRPIVIEVGLALGNGGGSSSTLRIHSLTNRMDKPDGQTGWTGPWPDTAGRCMDRKLYQPLADEG